MAQTMIDVLTAVAARQPHAPYSHYEGRTTRYGELWQQARQVGAGLQAIEATPGTRVAYLGKNTDRLMAIIFGAATVRQTCVVINWRLALPEWADILADSGARTLFVDADFLAQVPALRTRLPQIARVIAIDAVNVDEHAAIDFDRWVASYPPVAPHAVLPEDDFLQLYTSGTTGKPKGVPQTHAMHLSQHAQWLSRTGPYAADECFLVFMPLFHAAGITYPLFAVHSGTQVEIHRAAEPARILAALGSGRITGMVAVPTLLAMLLPHVKPGQFPALRRIHYGASSVDTTLLRQALHTFNCDFTQIYAATETTAALSILSPEDHRRGLDEPRYWTSAGRPGEGAEVRIANAQGEPVPTGDVGEIQVRSASVLRGYWRLPEATRDAFCDGWYRTGDVGRFDEEGYLYVVDRVKDMIISGGENVYSGEVENVLAQCPEFAEFAVVGAPDPQWGEVVTACVVFKPGASLTLDEVQARVRALLAGYKVPRRLECFDSLPRNPMGKLQKHLLRAQVLARQTT